MAVSAKKATAPARRRAKTSERRKPQRRQAKRDPGRNKSEVVETMLTSANGATRAELSKATGWPYVNLNVAAARAGKRLVSDETTGRFRLV